MLIDARIIIKWTEKNEVQRCGLDSFGSGLDEWWALVNTLMSLWIP
jgi:hypothetical protein